MLKILRETGGAVSVASFSFDSKSIISGHEDSKLRLWEVSSGKLLKTFNGHTKVVAAVSFSRDGKYLSSAGWDSSIKFWNVNTSKEIATLIAFSGSDDYVITTPDRRFDGTQKAIRENIHFVQNNRTVPFEPLYKQQRL